MKISLETFEEKLEEAKNAHTVIENYDLSHLNLPKMLISNITFRNCKFGTILNKESQGIVTIVGTNFESSEFENINFENCDVVKVNFKNCKIRDCSFLGSNLKLSSYKDCEISGNSNFRNAEFEPRQFIYTKISKTVEFDNNEKVRKLIIAERKNESLKVKSRSFAFIANILSDNDRATDHNTVEVAGIVQDKISVGQSSAALLTQVKRLKANPIAQFTDIVEASPTQSFEEAYKQRKQSQQQKEIAGVSQVK